MNLSDTIKNMKSFFKDLSPLETSQTIVLTLMAILLPFDWQLVIWLIPLLVVICICRIISAKRIGNPALSPGSRWALWLMVAYFAYQLLSLLYTSNKEDGLDMIVRRLPILVFTLCALASDSSFLSHNRMRTIMYIFTAAIVVKFFVRAIISLVLHQKICICCVFDPLHHTYMAMYLIFALGFIYSELFYHRKEMSRQALWTLSIVAVIIVLYTFFVNSRTGIVGLIALICLVVAHWTLRLKQWKRGIALFFLAAALGTGIHFILPECARRLTQTLTEMKEGDTSDARYTIFGSSVKAIGENGALGVGIGDKDEVLAEIYEESGKEYAISAQYNSHNIYLDAMLTMGIPGIALLLLLLGATTVIAWKQRDFILLSLLFSFAFCGLFEALLNRQMGIMFIGLFWMMLLSSGKTQRDADLPTIS